MEHEKKRILDVSPFGVVPPIHGGSLRIFNICQYLSQYYDVMLFSQGIRSNEFKFTAKPWLTEVNGNFCEYRYVNIPTAIELELLRRVGVPSGVFVGNILEFLKPKMLDRAIAKADCIQIEHPWQFEYIFNRKDRHTPIVLIEHNFEYDLLRQIVRPTMINQHALNSAFKKEQFAVENADLVITVSDPDKKSLCNSFDVSAGKIVTVPNGVDATGKKPVSQRERTDCKERLGLSGKYVVLFTGSAHPPNLDAVEKIRTIIAPNCAARDIVFLVVGKVGDKFRSTENIRFTGGVASVDDYIRCADIAINPMVSGSGTNLKMLEYFSYGLPVISTKEGARGLDLNRDIAIISDIRDFSENIIKVRKDPELHARLCKNARKLSEERYDWKVIGNQMVEIYKKILNITS